MSVSTKQHFISDMSHPEMIARPSLRGFAGQGGFFKNHAHKNCTQIAAGASVCGAATFIVFSGIEASASIFVTSQYKQYSLKNSDKPKKKVF